MSSRNHIAEMNAKQENIKAMMKEGENLSQINGQLTTMATESHHTT
ncbi:MAG: hypothetical protein JSU94_20315 [Phycisphaerales bacterium]|nr:MAG: hypothetical protein JSU94_20315 [Phycisphaerales bacterium]